MLKKMKRCHIIVLTGTFIDKIQKMFGMHLVIILLRIKHQRGDKTMDWIKDLLAIFSVILNGLPQGLLALTFGFASIPTAFAFLTGAVGNSIVGSVAPISFQAETITLAGTMGKNMRERLSMIFYGGVIMALIGVFGFLGTIVDFIGPVITSGMMAGVGIMLARVAIDMCKKSRIVGGISLASAFLTFLFTKDLVYTIAISVILSSVVSRVMKQDTGIMVNGKDKIQFKKPILNSTILRGALSMVCLNIGANIAFGNITGSIAGKSVNIDQLAVISSLADMSSSLFGGGPVESIISATASAPHAVWAGVGMMILMAIILLSGLLPKIGKFVPSESIAGFLFVLGAWVTVPINAAASLGQNSLVGGITMTVTAITDPFFGMLAGLIMKLLSGIVGI